MDQSPIKICFLSLNAYPLFNKRSASAFGGAELQSYLLADELAKDSNYQVSFIVGNHEGAVVEKYGRISVYKLTYEPAKGLAIVRQFRFAKRLWSLLKIINADIYQQRAAGASAGIIAAFCRRYGRKFVYMTASEAEIKGGLRKRTWLESTLFYYGLKRANLLLTQNASHQQALKERFGKDSTVFKNIMAMPTLAKGLVKETILWIASSQPLKQPEVFLKLIRDFPNEKFVMVMPMHKHNSELFETISSQAKAQPNLVFREKVPFEETTEYYNQAKVFVNTSTFEGFPNTFVQAAASATPMLSLNVNPDGFLDREHCGLCANGDYQKLKDQLALLLGDKNLWQTLSDNALHYARENHDIVTNVPKYKLLITKIFGKE